MFKRFGRKCAFLSLLRCLLLSAALLGTYVCATASTFVQLDYNVSLSTRARGTVFIELFDDRPLTRDNFLAYVNAGKYNGVLMHRLAYSGSNPFVLQGGGYYLQYQQEPKPLDVSLNPNLKVDLDGNSGTANPTVPNEFANSPSRSNVKGTLAMAKLPGDPNSATSEFFFNLNNNAGSCPNGLDCQNGGFTVFASVVGDGMNLIDAYAGLVPLPLDQDANDDGTRDAGPFGAVPSYLNGGTFLPLLLNRAHVVNYMGNGVSNAAGTISTNTFVDTGAIFTGPANIFVSANRTLGVREGYSFAHSIINSGTVAPGLQLGVITIPNYQQETGGALAIQIRNTTADTEYDKLNVTGTALLKGELNVSFLNNFSPQANNTFTVVSASTIIGSFERFDLPLLSAGLVWNISKTITTYDLKVVAADFNKNGIVDMADYVLWRNYKGTSSGATLAQGDADGNGAVNDADYFIWRSNFGNIRGTTAGSGGGSLVSGGVPEPGTAALIAIGTLGLFTDRRRRSARKRSRLG